MVRFQHLHPVCIGRQANVGNKRTTSKFMILVEFSNLTFDSETDITRVSNVKFIPLGEKPGRRHQKQRTGWQCPMAPMATGNGVFALPKRRDQAQALQNWSSQRLRRMNPASFIA